MPSGQSITHSYRMELFLNILEGTFVLAIIVLVFAPCLIFMCIMWFYFVKYVFELSKTTIAELW